MSSTRPVLVTGATGFIGFHTARALCAEGRAVRVLARDAAKAERLLGPLGIGPDAITVGDMTDPAAVRGALEGCGSVIHAAAGVSVTGGQSEFSANLHGTENVIGAAIEAGVYSIFVSSLTAIFDPSRKITEDAPLVRSRSKYGRSKVECDRWVRDRQSAGEHVAIVYPPGVVGPDDPGLSESVRAYRSFLRGTLQSSGGNQMLDVRDLALLLARMAGAETPGRIVAGGHFFDWDAFTALLEKATGARIPRIRAPGWALRLVGRTLDVVGAVTGRTMPMGGEGLDIATRFPEMVDSAAIADLGVRWRAPEETLTDLFRWLVEAGRLPARAVPGIGAEAKAVA